MQFSYFNIFGDIPRITSRLPQQALHERATSAPQKAAPVDENFTLHARLSVTEEKR